MDFFVLTVVSAQSNHIALVSRDKNHLLLAKTTENRRVRPACLVTCLKGECDVRKGKYEERSSVSHTTAKTDSYVV
jgi:hypothetical protein